MKFVVEFPFPGKEQREEIWRKVYPPQAPLGELDYEYLVENFGSNPGKIVTPDEILNEAEAKGVVFTQLV
jgi:hypothetical protein